jgi:hypothetical protein
MMRGVHYAICMFVAILWFWIFYQCSMQALEPPVTSVPTTSLPPVVSFERAGGDYVG